MTGSICDRCQRPGACCTMMLNPPHGWPYEDGKNKTAAEVERMLRDVPQRNVNDDFETLRLHPLFQNKDGYWTFWCDAWVAGRCSIYDHRPNMCRSYKPQSDRLCWHHDEETAHLREPPAEKGIFVDLRAPISEGIPK